VARSQLAAVRLCVAALPVEQPVAQLQPQARQVSPPREAQRLQASRALQAQPEEELVLRQAAQRRASLRLEDVELLAAPEQDAVLRPPSVAVWL